MIINLQFKKYTPNNPHEHPFLKEKEFRITAYKKDSRYQRLTLVKNQIEISDQEVTRVDFEFESFLKYRREKYPTIEIIQSFQLQWDDNPYLDKPKFHLVPHRWFCDPQYEQGLHPLLTIDNKTGTILIDCLVIDLTTFWRVTHQENKNYLLHEMYWENGEIDFKVLAHLAGPPLIWRSEEHTSNSSHCVTSRMPSSA